MEVKDRKLKRFEDNLDKVIESAGKLATEESKVHRDRLIHKYKSALGLIQAYKRALNEPTNKKFCCRSFLKRTNCSCALQSSNGKGA